MCLCNPKHFTDARSPISFVNQDPYFKINTFSFLPDILEIPEES